MQKDMSPAAGPPGVMRARPIHLIDMNRQRVRHDRLLEQTSNGQRKTVPQPPAFKAPRFMKLNLIHPAMLEKPGSGAKGARKGYIPDNQNPREKKPCIAANEADRSDCAVGTRFAAVE
jgi:hypothetical protein